MTEDNNMLEPKVSCSPDRNTFQEQSYLDSKLETGEEPDSNYLEMFQSIRLNEKNKMRDPEWRKNNLEYDLRITDWMLDKVRNSDTYAQNLYAALCNNSFIQNDVWPILKGVEWGCSWRYAGGIVADMKEKGDYIDWYCSGISGEQGIEYEPPLAYVSEGQITDEIRTDLLKLGWIIAPGGDNELYS
jgi:hypothetical protein